MRDINGGDLGVDTVVSRTDTEALFPRLPVRRVLAESWDIYRREMLLVLPALLVARASVVVAATLLVEIPVVVAHILSADVVSGGLGEGGGIDLVTEIGIAGLYASLGHHLLSGVLERVVASERHDHESPTLRATLRGLPWGRLVVADVVLAVGLTLLLVAFVVPRLVIGPFMVCVMPLLSMRHENLRTVWGASWNLVRGSWMPVFVALAITTILQLVLIEGAGELVEQLTHDHLLESLAHGLAGFLVIPFVALVPVVITFDLLELRGIEPSERY